MRALLGALACLASWPFAAHGWQVVNETPEAVVSVDLASLERDAGVVSFRERHALRSGKIDPGSLRPLREELHKRVIDCSRMRVATLSRAVFTDNDAMVDHMAVKPGAARWKTIAPSAPLYKLVCRPLPQPGG